MAMAVQKFGYLNKFLRTHNYNNYRAFSRYFSDKSGAEYKELKEFEEIESALFDNNKHKPVDTKEILKEYRQRAEKTRNEIHKTPRKTRTTQNSAVVNESDLKNNYKKVKLGDPFLGKVFLTAKSKKSNQIVVEGRRLILEAINCSLKLQYLLFSKNEDLDPILNVIKSIQEVEIYKVPQQSLRTWSSLTTCPGLIAIFERTNNQINKHITDDVNRLPITVICDNIREPNNLGSIIRTCAALPCHEVIIMKGCCDPWETKALRGGCGGQFRINVENAMTWEDLSLDENVPVLVAENNFKKASSYPLCTYTDVEVSNIHNYVIIGGETQGISPDAYRFMTQYKGCCINIPLAKGVDSLNTSSALTLILFEMRRHLETQLKRDS